MMRLFVALIFALRAAAYTPLYSRRAAFQVRSSEPERGLRSTAAEPAHSKPVHARHSLPHSTRRTARRSRRAWLLRR